eukprot:5728261-Pleurochrysis_carterae.AAC.1
MHQCRIQLRGGRSCSSAATSGQSWQGWDGHTLLCNSGSHVPRIDCNVYSLVGRAKRKLVEDAVAREVSAETADGTAAASGRRLR